MGFFCSYSIIQIRSTLNFHVLLWEEFYIRNKNQMQLDKIFTSNQAHKIAFNSNNSVCVNKRGVAVSEKGLSPIILWFMATI